METEPLQVFEEEVEGRESSEAPATGEAIERVADGIDASSDAIDTLPGESASEDVAAVDASADVEGPPAQDGVAPAEAQTPGGDPAPNADDPVAADQEISDSPEIVRLAGILESLLFAAGTPTPLPRLVDALQGPSKQEVVAGLRHLAARLEQEERGIRLVQVAGGYQLRTATMHGPWVRRLLNAKPPRLSRPMLETLAIVAYRQPCTRVEVEAIRGVDADATLTTLIERRMVRIVGRKEAPGRPILYGTTREFLEIFGLPDLSALPPLPELAEAASLLTAPDLTIGPGGVVPTEGPVDAPAPADDGERPAAIDLQASEAVEAAAEASPDAVAIDATIGEDEAATPVSDAAPGATADAQDG